MATTKINYTAFADFLNNYQDVFAVKRFRELQIRNLLFYQAELAHLREELEEIEKKDTALPSKHVTSRWMPEMAKEPVSGSSPTLSLAYSQKMLQIRRTLTSYNNTVEQYKRLDQIPNPQRSDIKLICDWLNGQHTGAAFLAGDVEDVWNIQLANGSVSPAGVEDFYGFTENDGVAFRIGQLFASISRLLFRSSSSAQPHHIDTTTSGGLGQALLTAIASVFPVLPIVVFYFVKKAIVRIGLIIVFTAVFAAIMVIGMGLKSDKTLAITTAISAIQVVYVGSTSNSTDS